MGVACPEDRLRFSWISLVLATGIDLFDQNVGMVYAEVSIRYSWISLVLIYLIKMWVWHKLKLDSDVHGNHWYCFFDKMWMWHVLRLGSDAHGYHWY